MITYNNVYIVNTKGKKNAQYIQADNKTDARKTFARMHGIKNFRTIEVKLHSRDNDPILYNND